MMTGLTQDILSELKRPFPIGDHGLRAGGFGEQLVYLTEEPLADRLSEIDPNWEFKIVSTIITDFNLSRPDSCTVTADLTICGITRSGVGTCVANMKLGEKIEGKWIKFDVPLILPLSETEIKGAATDALKRCARQFGVGAYLLRLGGVKIRNENDFANWYKREFGGRDRKTAPPVNDGELDAHLAPKATPAQILAGDTFPFDADWKTSGFDVLRKNNPSWNKAFWAAVSDLEIPDLEVHEVAAVDSMNHYDGKVGDLWLALCERKLENAKGD